MDRQDSESERQRLTKLYAGMADGELEAIATDSAELTDLARRALTDELARRRTSASETIAVAAPEGYSVELADVVSIRQFRDLPEALLAQGMLGSAEIESFLVDDNMIRMDWFYSNLVGAVAMLPVIPFVWTTPTSALVVALMVLIGALGSGGHYLLILGHRLAPASTLAPFIYTQIVWTTTLGFLVFGDLPNRWTILGGLIVVASGLYLLNRERKLGKPEPSAPVA